MYHTIDEQKAIAADIGRDLGAIAAHLVMSTIRDSKHWGMIRDAAIDDGIESGVIVREADLEVAKQEANDKLSGLDRELDRAQDEIGALREKLGYQAACLDRMQEMIVSGNSSEALDLLREIFPEHQFLSPAAEHMLAGIRGQGTLVL